MSVTVTFQPGTPAPDMTRDQLVTWLLGMSAPVSIGTGMLASYAVDSMVSRLAASPDGAISVKARDGQRWQVTVTRAGRWYNRRCTFHAERLG